MRGLTKAIAIYLAPLLTGPAVFAQNTEHFSALQYSQVVSDMCSQPRTEELSGLLSQLATQLSQETTKTHNEFLAYSMILYRDYPQCREVLARLAQDTQTPLIDEFTLQKEKKPLFTAVTSSVLSFAVFHTIWSGYKSWPEISKRHDLRGPEKCGALLESIYIEPFRNWSREKKKAWVNSALAGIYGIGQAAYEQFKPEKLEPLEVIRRSQIELALNLAKEAVKLKAQLDETELSEMVLRPDEASSRLQKLKVRLFSTKRQWDALELEAPYATSKFDTKRDLEAAYQRLQDLLKALEGAQ